MPVDWDATVQAATQAAFAIPITLYPKAGTGPLAVATDGNPLSGILRYQVQEFGLDDGSKVSTEEITLGIRLSSFPVYPQKGDTVTILSPIRNPYGLPPGLNRYTIDRFNPDGLAGASLVLKALQSTQRSG